MKSESPDGRCASGGPDFSDDAALSAHCGPRRPLRPAGLVPPRHSELRASVDAKEKAEKALAQVTDALECACCFKPLALGAALALECGHTYCNRQACSFLRGACHDGCAAEATLFGETRTEDREQAQPHVDAEDAENSPLTPSASVLRLGLTQDFVAVYGAFMLFAFISALPRGLALLAISSRDIPFADMQEVLEEKVGFGNMITECKVTDHVWTGLSLGGHFHKALVISDYAFFFVGPFLAFVAVTYGTFGTFTQMSRSRKAVSLFFVILAAVNQTAGMLLVIGAHNKSLNDVMYAPHILMQVFGVWTLFTIIVLVFLLLTILADRTSEGTRSILDMMKLGFAKFRTPFTIMSALLFCMMVDDIQRVALNFFDHAIMSDWEYHFIGVTVPLVSGKSVMMVLRMINGSLPGSLPLGALLMFPFMVNSYASMAARRFNFVDDQLNIVVLNCLLISAVEILSRVFILCFVILTRGTELQRARINALTLDELLHLHDRIRYWIDEYSGYMLTDHVCEIAVCFTTTMQYLFVPQWVVRQTHDDYRARVFRIPLSFTVQLIVELVVDLLLVYSSYRGVESLVPFRVLCERVLWNRHLILFSFGIMVIHGINLWPKCTTCGNPWECLLFIECARGPVKLGTDANVCGKYRRFQNNTNLELLAIHNSQRRKHGVTHNLSLGDLACARKDVNCGEWEVLGVDT